MKMKYFAMLALSGLLAASCAYIAPAMAEDANNGQSMQPPADNTPNSNVMQSPSQSDNQNGNNSDNTSSDQNNNPGNSSVNPSDDGGPDTATGDDDY